MTNWIEIDYHCQNCGKQLSVRRTQPQPRWVISGFEPLDYRHADGTTECVIKMEPIGYDACAANRRYKDALSAAEKGLAEND